MRLIISVIVLIISLIICGCHDENVLIVREGSVISYPNIKIGDAFDKFFSDGKWKSFRSKENDEVVEFNGKAIWNDKLANFKFQFIVKGNSFELYTTSVNGKFNNPLISAIIMGKVLDTYESNYGGVKQALLKNEEKKYQPFIEKKEYPAPLVLGLERDEDLNFTGKKVVARIKKLYVTKDPSGRAEHKVEETLYGQTYEHLGESNDGNFYRVYVADYGGAYIEKKYTKLMDKEEVIGSVTIQENTHLQEKPSLYKKYKIGECRRGESYEMLAFIHNDHGLWYQIKLKNGSKGFIVESDAKKEYTFDQY